LRAIMFKHIRVQTKADRLFRRVRFRTAAADELTPSVEIGGVEPFFRQFGGIIPIDPRGL